MKIEIVRADGMTNIDCEEFSYASIDGMYKTGDDCGLQVNDPEKEQQIAWLCNIIHENLKMLEGVL